MDLGPHVGRPGPERLLQRFADGPPVRIIQQEVEVIEDDGNAGRRVYTECSREGEAPGVMLKDKPSPYLPG